MNWVGSLAVGFVELPKRFFSFKTKPINTSGRECIVEEIQRRCLHKANSLYLEGHYPELREMELSLV